MVLRAAQMPGYRYRPLSDFGAYSAAAGFAGSSSTAFPSVISGADVEDTAAFAQAVNQGAVQAFLGEPGGAKITGLQPLGTSFAAIEYTQADGSSAGVILWTQGRAACLILVGMTGRNLPDMQAALQLARLQEANALAAQR